MAKVRKTQGFPFRKSRSRSSGDRGLLVREVGGSNCGAVSRRIRQILHTRRGRSWDVLVLTIVHSSRELTNHLDRLLPTLRSEVELLKKRLQ